MKTQEAILLGMIAFAMLTALSIGGYLLYRKLSSINPNKASESFESNKETFEYNKEKAYYVGFCQDNEYIVPKGSAENCRIMSIGQKEPKGWICYSESPNTNIKKCCPPPKDAVCEIFSKEEAKDFDCVDISNELSMCCPEALSKSKSQLIDNQKSLLEKKGMKELMVCQVNGKSVPSGELSRFHDCLNNLPSGTCPSSEEGTYSELKLNNHYTSPLDIYYHSSEKELSKEPKLLATIAPNTFVYVYYDPSKKSFRPGCIFYPFLHGSKTKIFNEVVLGEEDYEIHFIEPSGEHLRTYSLQSPNILAEIPSLKIVNHSYQPWDVYYREKYLGRCGIFCSGLDDYFYSIYSDNDMRGFRIGSHIKIKMVGGDETKFQTIRLDMYTTTITIGDSQARPPSVGQKGY